MALVFFSLFAFLFVAAAAAIDVDTAGWLLRVGACSVEDINGGATRAFLDDDGAAASSSAADGSSSAPPPVTLSRVRLLQNVLHAALQQHPLRSDDEHFVASLEIAGAVLSPDDAGYGVAEEAADEASIQRRRRRRRRRRRAVVRCCRRRRRQPSPPLPLPPLSLEKVVAVAVAVAWRYDSSGEDPTAGVVGGLAASPAIAAAPHGGARLCRSRPFVPPAPRRRPRGAAVAEERPPRPAAPVVLVVTRRRDGGAAQAAAGRCY